MDKTGRIQQFTQDGEFVRIAAKIDAYLGNAFVVDDNMALIACSGIVLDKVYSFKNLVDLLDIVKLPLFVHCIRRRNTYLSITFFTSSLLFSFRHYLVVLLAG